MSPEVAQAVLSGSESYREHPSVATAGGLIRTWLRAHGYVEDRWGNWLKPDNANRRWHFKDRVFNEQRKIDGEWRNVSSNSYLDSANKLMSEAAKTLGKEEIVAAVEERKQKRSEAAETRRSKEASKAELAKAHEIALGLVAEGAIREDMREEMLEFLHGRVDDKRRQEINSAVLVMRDKVLESGNHDTRGQNVDLARPPLLPFLSRSSFAYLWNETVDGHEYTIAIGRPKNSRNVELHIGHRARALFASTESIARAILSGRRESSAGDIRMWGSLTIPYRTDGDTESDLLSTLVTLQADASGAPATRGLYLWCMILRGYGLNRFVVREDALDVYARAALVPLRDSGSLDVSAEDDYGAMVVTCQK